MKTLVERLQSLGIAACDEAAARITALEAVRITVDTPNEVCDGYQTGTIAEIEGQYGPDALFWTQDWGEEVVDLQRKLDTSHERVAALEAAMREAVKMCGACGGTGNVERRTYDAASDEMEYDGFTTCTQCKAARKALEGT